MKNKRFYNFDGFKLTMQLDGYDYTQHKERVKYTLRNPEGKIVFAGNDFFASPLDNPTGIDSALALMVFLTVRPGDTDQEYFENYTPDQLSFVQSFECEQLSCTISDMEEKRYNRERVK